MKILKRRWWLAAAAAVLVAVSAVLTTVGSGGASAAPARATVAKAGNLGQLTGLLPRNKLTEESALQVDLSKETVRLPLYPGTAHGQKVWYVLLDASDAGLAHDLGVNYAPKLANIAVSDPAAVQTVTLGSPTAAAEPVRARGGEFRRRAGLQPGSHRDARADRLPAGQVPARCRGRTGVQPVHQDRRVRTWSTTRRSWPPATAPST